MTKHPRVVHRRPTPPYVPTFSVDRILSLTATPLIAGGIAAIGFYFTTNATIQQQAEQIKTTVVEIERANAKIEAVSKNVIEKQEGDNQAREKIREAFLASQKETTTGISKLDTRLAVAETQQNVANNQLQKISETLDRISQNFTQPATTSPRHK